MTDNNLNVRGTVEIAGDTSSIKRLEAQLKSLKTQIDKSFAKNPLEGSIIDPKVHKAVQKQLGLTDQQINNLKQSHLNMARQMRRDNKLTADSWNEQIAGIKATVNAFKRARGENRATLAKQLQDQIGQARAMRYVWSQEHERHQKAVARHNDVLMRLDLAKQRGQEKLDRIRQNNEKRSEAEKKRALDRQVRVNRQYLASLQREENRASRDRAREERQSLEERARLRRNLGRGYRGIRDTGAGILSSGNSVLRSAGIGGALSAAGVVMAGRSTIKSATDLDRSEMNARINMDQSIPGLDARSLRDRILPKSVAMGQDPARYMQTVVEAAKAGVPEEWSEKTAEMVTQLSKAFGIEPDQAMEGMGYAIAQEYGAGRLKDLKGVRKLGNISAFLAAKTAARPDQMLSFLRTGMGSGAQLGLSQEDTLAFGASAIQAGAQGQQASRFLGTFGSEIFGLKMKQQDLLKKRDRSQEEELFLKLPGKLGFGSYGELIQKFRKNPGDALFDLIKSFQNIKDPIVREQAQTALFGQSFGRFFSNMAQSPAMLDRTRRLSKEASGQSEDNDFLSQAYAEFMKSLEYLIDRIKSVWSVLKSELGDVLKPYVEQLSSWVSEWYNAVKTSGIKDRFAGFLRGLTEGFLGHPGTFRDLLNEVFGKPGDANGPGAEKFFEFAKGFATGLKEVVAVVGSVAKSIGKAFYGSDNAEAMGKMAGHFAAIAVALVAIAPFVGTMAAIVTFLTGLAGVLGLPGMLALAATIANNVGVKDSQIRRPGESYGDWMTRRRAKKSSYNAPSDSDPLFTPTSYTGGGFGSAFSSIAGLRSNSSATSLFNSTPGGALPNFGAGRNGIINRNSIPSFNGTGGSSGGLNKSAFERIFAGTQMAGKYDQVMAAAKQHGISPSLLAGVMAHETGQGKNLNGKNPGGIMDPATNSMRKMQFNSLDDGINKTASTVAKNFNRAGGDLNRMGGFYAPRGAANDPNGLNKSWPSGVSKFMGQMADTQAAPSGLGDPVKTAERFLGKNEWNNTKEIGDFIGHDPRGNVNAWCARFVNAALSENGMKGTGSAAAASFYKWGDAVMDGVKRGDIMVAPHHVGMATGKVREDGAIQMISGNHGDAVGYSWEHPGKYQLRRGNPIQNVPSPADAIRNVPATPAPDASLGGPGGATPGNVAIHINGGNHDPEALATLVQRRVDESMNWRAHDSESEYT